jgi:hypothetical protein
MKALLAILMAVTFTSQVLAAADVYNCVVGLKRVNFSKDQSVTACQGASNAKEVNECVYLIKVSLIGKLSNDEIARVCQRTVDSDEVFGCVKMLLAENYTSAQTVKGCSKP